MSNNGEIESAVADGVAVLREAEDALDLKVSSMERLAGGMLRERRTMRRIVVGGFITLGIAIVLALSSRDHADRSETASRDAKTAVAAVDNLRLQQGLAICERVNDLRLSIRRAMEAEQQRWDTVTAALNLRPRPDDTPEQVEARARFVAALDKAEADFKAVLDSIRPTDCLAVTPPTTPKDT